MILSKFVKFILPIILSRTKWGLQGSFLAILQLCVLFIYLNFFCTNMFNGPANLRKFHRRKDDKSYSKDSYFLCRKALRKGIEFLQDLYLSTRKLWNLSPSGNPSFFSVDLFSKHRGPMNITDAVAGNPRFHHIKTVLS